MRVDVLAGAERRRRWSGDEKMRIVEETLQPGAKVTEVAQRNQGVTELGVRVAADGAEGATGHRAIAGVRASARRGGGRVAAERCPDPRSATEFAAAASPVRAWSRSIWTMDVGCGSTPSSMPTRSADCSICWSGDDQGPARRSGLAGELAHSKGFPGLALLVQQVLNRNPHSGHLFCFRDRRADLLKVIWDDGPRRVPVQQASSWPSGDLPAVVAGSRRSAPIVRRAAR